MNFSEKMAELDKILRKLEGDSILLEEALSEFEKGIGLVRDCRTYLEEAKQKVTMLTDDGEVAFDLHKKEDA
ncbi:MAG: exodeoxyribonuclease VII small subunit [Synergistaceae bacterium]|nr:exodeoxyribonuclease VII small subunit [Synergistaceae bacterium]